MHADDMARASHKAIVFDEGIIKEIYDPISSIGKANKSTENEAFSLT